MKYIIIAATAASMAISSVAIAQTTTAPVAPSNKADCEKAKMKWDDKANRA